MARPETPHEDCEAGQALTHQPDHESHDAKENPDA
jgi:hypothetical protein